MNLIIERVDGALYDLKSLGIDTLYFRPDSPSLETDSDVVGEGEIDLGSRYKSRMINASFFSRAMDYADYPLMRNELFKLFQSKEPYYVRPSEMPGIRWKVKSESTIDLERIANTGVFGVQFKSYSPFSHSIGTTLDPLTFDSELWQIGQGLTVEEPEYTHTTSLFSIYNAGDEKIDPREVHTPVVIEFMGASNNLKIKNITTGDEWSYTGTTHDLDTIKLDGIRSTKNGLSIFRDTNRKLITIASGWNELEVTGATDTFTISFDFRFYYI
ncbi:phage tail family protein [Rossellomorea aquimaris]|uniref:phage tail family protein n=1 Tax=Rossellomorea aquimaris TaxID=189382 RepID=UPI0011E9884B|nr:phage tail family protein [Rossellomorea aquimaris]TYS91893.1 phage tail family protein [Rossellomorea aquimaris]